MTGDGIPLNKRKHRLTVGGQAHEMVGFTIAEGVSIATSLAVVGIADQVAPKLLKNATSTIAKTVIEPHLDRIEKGLSKICKLKECKPDENKTRQERAEALAKTVIVFSASWVTAMAMKLATRRLWNHHYNLNEQKPEKWWHMSRPEQLIFGLDEGVHYGSLLLMNTGTAKHTDDMIRTTTSILTKLGIPKKKAQELSSMAMIWELPNVLGWGAGLLAIHGKHKYGWAGFKQGGGSHIDKLIDGVDGTGHTGPAKG